ncbi:hypothetical protein KAU45_10880 [bacterium]|nr:hypothetical protein [bacterium]
MATRIQLPLLLISAVTASVPFAGLRGGVEGYTWPELGGWRTTFGVEVFVGPDGAAFEFTYGINFDFNTVNRMTLGLIRYYPVARRHALRFGFGTGMSYPRTRDWYTWEHRFQRAWWEMNLDGGWRWEFTSGLALLADVKLSMGAGQGETGVGLTGWLGLVVYP